jgi:methylglutaconyl-CoA hydratase
MSSELTLELRERAAIITLCRPSAANSLSRALVRSLGELVAETASNTDVRAIVLTGAGNRVFSAGADLKERETMTEADVLEMLRAYRTELGHIDTCPKPVIAAINGHALGGGLELALLCDLRIAVPEATFGLPETSLGIIPGAGGTQRLTHLVGVGRAKELILLGRRLTATEALAYGLIERVAESPELLDETLKWIAPILQGAPLAQRAALNAIDAACELPLVDGLEKELIEYETCLRSEDRLEGLLARREKRDPRYQGR